MWSAAEGALVSPASLAAFVADMEGLADQNPAVFPGGGAATYSDAWADAEVLNALVLSECEESRSPGWPKARRGQAARVLGSLVGEVESAVLGDGSSAGRGAALASSRR